MGTRGDQYVQWRRHIPRCRGTCRHRQLGGVPNATAAATAQYIYLIAIGLFVVSAVVTILDLEWPLQVGDGAAESRPASQTAA